MNTWYEDLMQFGFGYYFMGYLVQVMLYNPNKASSISINLIIFMLAFVLIRLLTGRAERAARKKIKLSRVK